MKSYTFAGDGIAHSKVAPNNLDPADPWEDGALCNQVDPELHFPDKGESTSEAKRICSKCDVRVECLATAFKRQERFGVWGGLSERERRRLFNSGWKPGDPMPAIRAYGRGIGARVTVISDDAA